MGLVPVSKLKRKKLISIVLGDRKSLIEIAELFAKVYGFKPDLHNLGSLEDLHQNMHKNLQMNPDDFMAWIPK